MILLNNKVLLTESNLYILEKTDYISNKDKIIPCIKATFYGHETYIVEYNSLDKRDFEFELAIEILTK